MIVELASIEIGCRGGFLKLNIFDAQLAFLIVTVILFIWSIIAFVKGDCGVVTKLCPQNQNSGKYFMKLEIADRKFVNV